jgi:hypothetical protein
MIRSIKVIRVSRVSSSSRAVFYRFKTRVRRGGQSRPTILSGN